MLNQTKTEFINTISERDILNRFYNFPSKIDMKIGMELERLPVDSKKLAIPYSNPKNKGVKNILENISKKYNWVKIFDNNVLIGLKKDGSTITLEPGCQVEISVKPQKTVENLKNEIQKIDEQIFPIFKDFNYNLLETGISPISTAKEIEVFPKKRYQYMAKYLPGSLASSMMRETAGIQVAIDFKNEEDAIKKLRIFSKISPIMTAMFANSPVKEGQLTGYKSTRALAWLNTDNDRCGLIGEKLFDKNYNFTFEDYMETVLNIPMLYISRHIRKTPFESSTNPFSKDILINGKITFKEFLKYGYEGFYPEFKDYEIQQSLFFPEVRLKNYLEIRNHDCQRGDLKYSIPAIYKGLAYNEDVLNTLIKMFEKFTYQDVQQARYDVPKYALNGYFGDYKISDLAKEIIKLSKDGLKNDGDKKFIEPIESLVNQGLCPADISKM